MTTIFPKRRSARPVQTSAPSWQCPACGAAYAKGADTGVSARSSTPVGGGEGSWLSGTYWVKLVLFLLHIIRKRQGGRATAQMHG